MMKSPFENDKKTKKGQFSIYKSFFFAVSCVVKLLLEVCWWFFFNWTKKLPDTSKQNEDFWRFWPNTFGYMLFKEFFRGRGTEWFGFT